MQPNSDGQGQKSFESLHVRECELEMEFSDRVDVGQRGASSYAVWWFMHSAKAPWVKVESQRTPGPGLGEKLCCVWQRGRLAAACLIPLSA